MPGLIIIKPFEAHFTTELKSSWELSPFCHFSMGEVEMTTDPCYRGGANPKWVKSIRMPIPVEESTCTLEIRDKDVLKDKDIGKCEIPLDEIIPQKNVRKWFKLKHENKEVGDILMEITYLEEDAWQLRRRAMSSIY